MSEQGIKLTPEQEADRRKRNIFVASALVLFGVLIFLVTVIRLSANISA